MDNETAKDRRARDAVEALTQQLAEVRRDASCERAAAVRAAVNRARRNWAQQGSAEYSELVVTDAMVAAAEDAYMPFGDMRLALETALQAVVRTD